MGRQWGSFCGGYRVWIQALADGQGAKMQKGKVVGTQALPAKSEGCKKLQAHGWHPLYSGNFDLWPLAENLGTWLQRDYASDKSPGG